MKFPIALPIFCFSLFGRIAIAATDPVINTAERHAYLQTQGLPGKVSITVGRLAPGTHLPSCTTHEAFTPPGVRLWGKTHIGVRCLEPNIWSVLIPIQITITSQYMTTARPLVAGQLIQADDLQLISGDLSTQPAGVITDPATALGKMLRNSLAAGQPLRTDQLMAPLIIRSGQTVRLVSKGFSFSVSSEGKAINNVAEGQVVQIRMPSGLVVSGIAKADGTVEVAN